MPTPFGAVKEGLRKHPPSLPDGAELPRSRDDRLATERFRPRIGVQLTAQGHPRAIFRRAVERKNLLIAEATARELGALHLTEALDLVCLVAEQRPDRLDAFGRRWLARLAEETELRLAEFDIVIAALCALPSEDAERVLRGFV